MQKSAVFLCRKSGIPYWIKLLTTSSWKKQPEITDELLTLIEGNTKWMVAFGFDKSSASGGLTIIECCAQIANILFIKDKLDTPFVQGDLKKLTEAVKNRISR